MLTKRYGWHNTITTLPPRHVCRGDSNSYSLEVTISLVKECAMQFSKNNTQIPKSSKSIDLSHEHKDVV